MLKCVTVAKNNATKVKIDNPYIAGRSLYAKVCNCCQIQHHNQHRVSETKTRLVVLNQHLHTFQRNLREPRYCCQISCMEKQRIMLRIDNTHVDGQC